MKIVELRTENIKNLKAIEITPDGSVILEGKNGAGKSAVLDSIFMALTGKKIDEPIRNGESRAEINVDLGEIKIKRVFTKKGDRLEVTSAKGASFKSPQGMLNEIIGNIAFDPLKFAELGKTVAGQRQQRDTLAKLVGLDFSELDKRRKELYDERTIKNREIKGADAAAYRPDSSAPLPLEALVAQMEVPAVDTPRAEISMAEKIDAVEELEKRRREHQEYEDRREALEGKKKEYEAEIASFEEDIAELENKIASARESIKQRQGFAAEMDRQIASLAEPEPVPDEMIDAARKALLSVEEENRKIRRAVEYDRKSAELESAKNAISELERQMLDIDLEKKNRVDAAEFPIPGLGITDEFVTFDKKPFGQLSTGEQIRVSTAVAMALNPKLRVIIIREGSLLDKEGLAEVVSLADKKDYQCWIERVADERSVGIFIEDGKIVEEEGNQ